MTSLEKRFIEVFKNKHPQCDENTVKLLLESNFIDFRTMKIALTRHYVEECVKRGCGKREAMMLVANDLATSYEYVKKAMYYYNDVNV